MISFLLPAYNEEENIPLIIERIEKAVEEAEYSDYEILFIDDHSADGTLEVLRQAAETSERVRYARLSRNSGSHVAILCGLGMIRGDCVLILAADGQDPPEVFTEMMAEWKNGSEVVWGARKSYAQKWLNRLLSKLFWSFMVNFTDAPPLSNGADMVLIDKRVASVLAKSKERNLYLWGLVGSIGCRQSRIYYDKAARVHVVTGWTLTKRIKVAVDATLAYSYAPIRIVSGLGFAVSGLGVTTFVVYVLNKLTEGAILGPIIVPGWTSLFGALLFFSGIQMLMLGLLGEYVWRILDQVRGRPLYRVESASQTFEDTTDVVKCTKVDSSDG